MDIANKLQELTEEILDFGNIINLTRNPSNTDFRNACDLFSKRLNYQLETIHTNVQFKDIRPEMQQTTNKLYQLSELISPCQQGSDEFYYWPGRLLDFCNQIQTLKKIAA
ncbi:hypothetical protein MNBD_GAMMA11-883 [hydrothermal vent metagenome]|uniref:Uncharacterized protein n=1 Tax=hydrothermal vent metagenome TaxID=652676 RepID=A0A3B0X933_9ZZZZ